MAGYYFEDLEVGSKVCFGHYPVTREEVVEFASRYDPQPFHLSDEGAAKTHFKKLAASGWHTAAMAMAMNVERMKSTPEMLDNALGAAGLENLKWLGPVYPGDTLRCEHELVAKRASVSRPEMGLIKQKVTVFNQDEVPVMEFTAIAMVRARPKD